MRCTNKMTKKPFKVLSTTAMAAALATSALVPAAVFAAEDNVNLSVSDYIVEKDGQLYSVDTATFLEMKAGKVAPTPKFVKTAAGKVYDLNDYLEAKSSNIGATMQDALELLAEDQSLEKDVTYGNVEIGEDGTPIYKPAPPTDLKVETVSAITQTIASDVATDLKFSVNGKEELTKAEFEEKYEGYEAKFSFNTNDLSGSKATGNVTAAKDFKYAVQVTDSEGIVLPAELTAADFVTVSVKSGAVETVTGAALTNELAYVTKDMTSVKFEATGAINGLGKTLTEVELEAANLTVTRAISSNLDVAYFENGKIVPVKEGNVTFNVYFAGVKEPVKVSVEVKADREETSIEKIENQKVVAGDVTLVAPKVLDQYGKVFADVASTLEVKLSDKEGKNFTTVEDLSTAKDLSAAGKYTVQYYLGEGTAQKLAASYTIETVAVDADALADTYTLSFDKDAKDKVLDTLDLYEANDVSVDVKGFYEGVEVTTANFGDLEAKSSNTAVTATYADGAITVAVDDTSKVKKGDTVTITLVENFGDLPEVKGTVTVKVENSAPQITELKLKDAKAKAITKEVTDVATEGDIVGAFTEADVFAALTAGKTTVEGVETEILEEEMITGVKFLNRSVKDGVVTGTVQVTLDSKFASKSFTFTGEVKAKAAEADTESPVIALGDVEATQTVANGADFTVPVLTATDNVDADVAVASVITNAEGAVLEEIDTAVAGVYTITYTAKDAANNAATPVVITVTVEAAAPEAPAFDFTATAADVADGALEFEIVVAGTLGTEAAEGTPEVLVTVEDVNGDAVLVSEAIATAYVAGESTVTVTTDALAVGTYTVTVTIDDVVKTIDLEVTL